MTNENRERPHLFPQGITETDRFISPRQMVRGVILPDRDRAQHAANLRSSLAQINIEALAARDAQRIMGLDEDLGLILEFESFPDIQLAFEQLSNESFGIELLNIRSVENRTFATVFVPDGRLRHFEKMLGDYVEERRSRNGRRLDHSALLNTISEIRKASLIALWTDLPELFPDDGDAAVWWEVWLPVRANRQRVIADFTRLASAQGLTVLNQALIFPERTVLLMRSSVTQLQQSMMTLNSIAELRCPKETAEFFDSLSPLEQPGWVEDLLARTTFTLDENVPHVCLLDTGTNRGHPLIEPALSAADMHVVEPGWGTDDLDGHGTEMAGLALFGDLTGPATDSTPIQIQHRIESVKLLPEDGSNSGGPNHHGYLTAEATSRPEITGPNRSRVFSMAVTATDSRDRGRPSAWSATLDRLASDAQNDGEAPRLYVVSAGNVRDPNAWFAYPASNSTDGIHDPAQSWNVLTVGAFTNLVDITEQNSTQYSPVAAQGGLSPFSTTSSTWDSVWPLKPDVLFEGGNAAKDRYGAVCMPSLGLLTTNAAMTERLLTTSNATSAATALASRMAAQVMFEYPELWPETVRALLVHSAEWTAGMKAMYLSSTGAPTKSDYENLIKHCGFGVPNLDVALWNAADSLTLVVQESLQPFMQELSKVAMRDMHLHQLPWPVEELQSLGELQVEMRVTLSYFVEPNPSARGIRSKYRYASHGLRFDVKRPLESDNEFKARVNVAARDEEFGDGAGGSDDGWILGKQKRHRGSIHSDTWVGTAAELASRALIGVYPAMGWWRTRTKLARANRKARYALIISIKTPETEVDIYNAVKTKILQPVIITANAS